MGAISTPNLQLLTALASHCLLRSQHAVHSSRQQLQQLTQPLPAGFPPGPREYDLAWDLARDPLHCLESLRASYGDLVGFKLASRPIVLASSPSYAREVFITQSSTFVKVRETPLLFFVFLLLSSLFLDFRSIPGGKEEIHAPLCLGLFCNL